MAACRGPLHRGLTMQKQPGTARILVCRSHTIGGALIRHFDNGPTRNWSHGGILLRNDHVIEATTLHGVRAIHVEPWRQRYSRIEILKFVLPDKAGADRWLAEQVGKGYDYLAVFGRLFRADWHAEDRWHCWELIEAYLRAGGLQRWRDGPQRITPNMGYSNLFGVQ